MASSSSSYEVGFWRENRGDQSILYVYSSYHSSVIVLQNTTTKPTVVQPLKRCSPEILLTAMLCGLALTDQILDDPQEQEEEQEEDPSAARRAGLVQFRFRGSEGQTRAQYSFACLPGGHVRASRRARGGAAVVSVEVGAGLQVLAQRRGAGPRK